MIGQSLDNELVTVEHTKGLRHEEVSFKCYARDDKNAVRKWSNFNNNQKC